MKLSKIFLICLCVWFLNFKTAYSEILKNPSIKIIGNKIISKETILNTLGLNNNIEIDTDQLNLYQQKIFGTGFFSTVSLELNLNELTIKLKENPIIDYVFIEGLKDNKNIEEQIFKIITLKENTVFSESSLNSNTKKINSFLASLGYFKNSISYEIKQVNNNRVNIFFNVDLNKKFTIKNIFFIGDKKFSSSSLKDVITSTQDSWFSFFSSTNTPSNERVDLDISLLKNFYLNHGYYDVQIPSGSIEVINNNSANLIFVINAGQLYKFNEVVVLNKSPSLNDSDLRFIKKIVSSLKGNEYRMVDLSNLRNKITDYLYKNNINSEVQYSLRKEVPNIIDVSFEIREIQNKQFVGNIVVEGNDITEESVIRNNLFFAEGDLVSNLNIEKSKDKLKSLGFFKNVSILKEDLKNSQNSNITIKVEENATGEISAGAGVSNSEASISFSIREKNFLGKGINTNANVSFGTERFIGSIGFSNPDFNETGNTLNNTAFVTSTYYYNAAYKSKSIGDNLSLSYEIFQNINLETGLGISFDSIDTDTTASNLIKSKDGSYLTNKIFYNVNNDQRDRKFQTKNGYTFGFGQSLASFGSDIPYLSNNISGSFYNEFSQDFIGTIKYRVKSINSINNKDVMLSDRIFLSGSELRGFKHRSVGPMVDNEFIGGNYSYSTNFSTSFPNGLPDKWNTKSSLFFDVANVWGVDFESPDDSSKIRSSVGIGVSWVSPVGPISFTLAKAISKDSKDEVETFSFQLGGTF